MIRRNNKDWVDEFSGVRGSEKQGLAHQDLANYLYVVIYNHLLKKQAGGEIALLVGLTAKDLTAIGEDFVQETLEKLIKNDYALLDQYNGSGRFLSWVAAIIHNQARQEFRKAYWARRKVPPQETGEEARAEPWLERFSDEDDLANPEKAAMRQQVIEILRTCLGKLRERERLAFWGCVAEGERAKVMAAKLDTTETAVNLLVFRAKRKLQKLLREAGINEIVLEAF